MKKYLLLLLLFSSVNCYSNFVNEKNPTYFSFSTLLSMKSMSLKIIEQELLFHNWYLANRQGDTIVTYVFRKPQYYNISDTYLPNMLIVNYSGSNIKDLTYVTDEKDYATNIIPALSKHKIYCREPKLDYIKKDGVEDYFRTNMFDNFNDATTTSNVVVLLEENKSSNNPKSYTTLMIFWK